jgi:hypothetical protein
MMRRKLNFFRKVAMLGESAADVGFESKMSGATETPLRSPGS